MATQSARLAAPRVGPFAAFRVTSFRYQWPADLLTSWASQMELLILGWYVLVKTNSVFLLSAFGALTFVGTLLSPMFGVAGDRLGRRTLLCAMRASYVVLAAIIAALALAGTLEPVHVFPIVFLAGLIRPSDISMRNSLIGDTMPAANLMGALGLSRTTQDSARIFGALAGAGLFAAFGIGEAYVAVTLCYATSFLLTLGVSRAKPGRGTDPAAGAAPASAIGAHWRELRDGMAYAWRTPGRAGAAVARLPGEPDGVPAVPLSGALRGAHDIRHRRHRARPPGRRLLDRRADRLARHDHVARRARLVALHGRQHRHVVRDDRRVRPSRQPDRRHRRPCS